MQTQQTRNANGQAFQVPGRATPAQQSRALPQSSDTENVDATPRVTNLWMPTIYGRRGFAWVGLVRMVEFRGRVRGADGWCWDSRPTLARRLGVSLDSIDRHTALAIRMGLLERREDGALRCTRQWMEWQADHLDFVPGTDIARGYRIPLTILSDRRLNPGQKLVAAAINHLRGHLWRGVTRLAEELTMVQSTVLRAIKSLLDLGALVVERTKMVASPTGHRRVRRWFTVVFEAFKGPTWGRSKGRNLPQGAGAATCHNSPLSSKRQLPLKGQEPERDESKMEPGLPPDLIVPAINKAAERLKVRALSTASQRIRLATTLAREGWQPGYVRVWAANAEAETCRNDAAGLFMRNLCDPESREILKREGEEQRRRDQALRRHQRAQDRRGPVDCEYLDFAPDIEPAPRRDVLAAVLSQAGVAL